MNSTNGVSRLRISQGVKRLRESTLPLRAKKPETESSKEVATEEYDAFSLAASLEVALTSENSVRVR
jgi:hypothetical protein